MYVSHIELTNYRSCQRTVLDLNKDLSVLIGVNGSGKTNLLNGFLLLKRATTRPQRHYAGDEFISNVCRITVRFNVGKNREVLSKTAIKYTTDEENTDVVLNATSSWNFKDVTGRDEWISLPFPLNPDIRRYRQLSLHVMAKRDFIFDFDPRYFHGLTKVRKRFASKVFPIIAEIGTLIANTNYYGASQFTDPSKCPSFFEIEEEETLRRPFRRTVHLQFMYDLYLTYKRRPDEFNEFLSIIGKNGLNLVATIKYGEKKVASSVIEVRAGGRLIKKKSQKILVIPYFLIGKTKLSPNQLSEGTFRTIATLFYLITDKSRLLLIEEPEVCIHHGLLSNVIELIKTFSSKKQIVVTTHSDFILDLLEPSNVFIVRNFPDKGTKVKHVPKAMSAKYYNALKDYLNTTGNLGEYWRHGELES